MSGAAQLNDDGTTSEAVQPFVAADGAACVTLILDMATACRR